MPFVTGVFAIDAPASALNNAGTLTGMGTDNVSGVKLIRTREGAYPYVSAQSYRYWLRTTLEKQVSGWQAAPVFRDEKMAYTDANPISYWDDDLFGYFRAVKSAGRDNRETPALRDHETPTTRTIARTTPFHVGTLVSIAPVTITSDFGTFSRFDGDPVPHEHQFYRTTLKGVFSLDLFWSGTFSYRERAGTRNLDEVRIDKAKQVPGIEHLEKEKAYRLPLGSRIERISALFKGMSLIEGGAKLSLHYTDVSPALLLFAVTKGGNHIFHRVLGANRLGQPEFKLDVLDEMLKVNRDQLLSPLYIGWPKGYLDEERSRVEAWLELETVEPKKEPIKRKQWIQIGHPRRALDTFITSLENESTSQSWLV